MRWRTKCQGEEFIINVVGSGNSLPFVTGERHACGCALGRLFWHIVGDELRRRIWGPFAVDQVNGGRGPVMTQGDDCSRQWSQTEDKQVKELRAFWIGTERVDVVDIERNIWWEINLGWKRIHSNPLTRKHLPFCGLYTGNLMRWVRYKLGHAVPCCMALPDCSHELIPTALRWSGFQSWCKIGDFFSIF